MSTRIRSRKGTGHARERMWESLGGLSRSLTRGAAIWSACADVFVIAVTP